MITDLRPRVVAALLALRAALTVRARTALAPALEVAGFLCAGVFLHQVWAPLVWGGAAVVLILAGQRR